MRALLALFALGVLIFAHELGHLVFGWMLGIRASHVAFGMGPPLWTSRRKGLRFSLGAIPLGGFVELEGENPHRSGLDREPAGYTAQRPWKRLLVLFGGPFTNALVALVALFALYLTGTHLPVPLTVGTVVPGSEAAYAQLRPGDRIRAVNDVPVGSWTALAERLGQSVDTPMRLNLERAEGPATGPITVTVTPRPDAPGGPGRIGISQQYVYRVLRPGAAFKQALKHLQWLAGEELSLTAKLIRGARGTGLAAAGQMVRQASSAATSGLDALLRVLSSLSVALALFYLLPLPALDGGRMLLVAGEMIFRRKLSPRAQTLVQTLGLVILLGLLLWIALTDARRLLLLAH